jgi:hypothetical protein
VSNWAGFDGDVTGRAGAHQALQRQGGRPDAAKSLSGGNSEIHRGREIEAIPKAFILAADLGADGRRGADPRRAPRAARRLRVS